MEVLSLSLVFTQQCSLTGMKCLPSLNTAPFCPSVMNIFMCVIPKVSALQGKFQIYSRSCTE